MHSRVSQPDGIYEQYGVLVCLKFCALVVCYRLSLSLPHAPCYVSFESRSVYTHWFLFLALTKNRWLCCSLFYGSHYSLCPFTHFIVMLGKLSDGHDLLILLLSIHMIDRWWMIEILVMVASNWLI